MKYTIELSRIAEDFLDKISRKDLKKIQKKIDALENNPRPNKVEKLSGHDNLYRVRSGDYRIVYSIFHKKLQVLVFKIGHRREIYREL